MTKKALADSVGLFLVVAHFATLVLLCIFWRLDLYTFEEFTKSIAVIGPLFAVYTPTVIRALLANRPRKATVTTDTTQGQPVEPQSTGAQNSTDDSGINPPRPNENLVRRPLRLSRHYCRSRFQFCSLGPSLG
jgi:hypothetical protein